MIQVFLLNNEYYVGVVIGGGRKAVKQALKEMGYKGNKPDKLKVLDGLLDSRAKTICRPGLAPLIYINTATFDDPVMLGALAHEAFHAVELVCDWIGQDLSGEFTAHSIGAIVRETVKAVQSQGSGGG